MEAGAYTIDAMREIGFDIRDHRSQPVNKELLDWADFVVVAQPMHLERLEGHVESGKIVRLWDWIEGAESVEDPHGGPLDDHRRVAGLIGEAVEKMVEAHIEARRAARGR